MNIAVYGDGRRQCRQLRGKLRHAECKERNDRENQRRFIAAEVNITEAETVTAKLPKIEKRPQTGDSSNLILWIALLFVSVGALGGMTAYKKRKKK